MEKSPYNAQGDHREYNVYIETARVEQVWPRMAGWPLAAQIGPVLVSLEVALKILEDSLDEAETREYINDAAKVDVVAASVAAILTLIADIAFEHGSGVEPPRDGFFGRPSRKSAWNRVLRKLARVTNGPRIKATLRSRHDLAVRALGFQLGLARPRSRPGLDYDKWVRPDVVHGLYAPDRRHRYVEDPIFVRVHQACEGILEGMLVELNQVEAMLFKADYAAAERHVLLAARFMQPFERTISLLGEMSQFDYAPLRVALRDASGIQSARAQARKSIVDDHFWLFRQQLKHRGLDCFVVLANQVEFLPEYRLLQAFKTLARSVNESMSHHAHLVQNVLGDSVIGTAGFRILTLGEIAARPMLPQLAIALDSLTLWTNLAFADHSGIVIHEQELEHGVADKYDYRLPTAPCNPAQMTATVEKYFDAIREDEKEMWKELFTESPHFEAVRGTKPYVTEWNLDVFFRNFQKLFPKVLGAEYEVVEQGDNHLKVAWTLNAESFLNKMPVQFSGTETFYFDPEGRIEVAFDEWDRTALAEDIMQRHRAALAEATPKTLASASQ